MIRSLFSLLATVALVVATSAVEADAARFSRFGHRVLTSPRIHRQDTAGRAAKPAVYPRVRQIDGRTLWDLGKQKGQWPSLP
jgi:hypothetical protein